MGSDTEPSSGPLVTRKLTVLLAGIIISASSITTISEAQTMKNAGISTARP